MDDAKKILANCEKALVDFEKKYGINAFDAHKAAAKRWDAESQIVLAAMYVLGRHVPQHYVFAYMWYNLAAVSGDKDAISLRDGIAEQMTPEQVERAQDLSVEWFEKHPKPQDN